jgi:hypothetical protein
MRITIAVSLAVLGSACGNKKDAAPASGSATAPPVVKAPAPADAAAAAIDAGFVVWPATLEDRSVSIEWHDMKATLTGRVPVGWISRSAGSFTIPDGGNPSPMQPSIGYAFGGISCNGECDDKDMQNSMTDMWKSTEKGYAQVSYNSGNERMDNMKLDVKTLDEGVFTDGKYKAGRYKAVKVTRPADAQDVPAFMERLEAECVRHRKGDKFYIVATIVMPMQYEQTLWPLMLEACKTAWFR